MKRFWSHATAEGTQVRLDAKPLRAPEGQVLEFRTPRLAQAVAAEWDGVQGAVARDRLILTQLAMTAALRVAIDPAGARAALGRYAEHDLLCYRAAAPAPLVRLQAEAWDPWLNWAEARFGARLVITEGVVPVAQPSAALLAMQSALAALDADVLAALGVLVPALGSLVLGLAVAEGAIAAEAAHDVSLVDEYFQQSLWGQDAQAAERQAALRRDIEGAACYLALAKA